MEIYDEEELKRVKDKYKTCDFTELSYEEIFNALRQTLVHVFDDVLTFYITGINQVKLCDGEKYGYSDRYGEYPVVDLHISVTESLSNYFGKFCLTITPFNCSLDNDKKDAGVYGWRDKVITKVWRNFMKEKYGEAYETMFKEYFENKKTIKNEDAKFNMETEIKFNQAEYDKEISTII